MARLTLEGMREYKDDVRDEKGGRSWKETVVDGEKGLGGGSSSSRLDFAGALLPIDRHSLLPARPTLFFVGSLL